MERFGTPAEDEVKQGAILSPQARGFFILCGVQDE